ncbi:MAG: DNA polymerase III subunit gamma/tau [Flavobacteriales bacterium]|nr:DNA polymerase III subunit gamma/tau [Flavobacteriales bacterium]
MENFVVSARKYRPTTFDTVVGQEHVTKTLINEIKNNQLAQAFLFNGPRGVGKTTCARILAKEINKESITDESYDFSYNIFELDAASNNSVEDIRMLNEQVRIPPQIGKYKVYIIDEVHMLSAAAFNAFLKTLEEPPHYAIFILATTERHKILPTILSRCQVFTFSRITVGDIVNHLKKIGQAEGIEMEEEALHIIGQKADGALRDALSIFDQMISISGDKKLRYADVVKHLNVLDYDYYFKITDAFQNQDISTALLAFDEILNHGFDGQIFLNGLANHFRDLMVGRTSETLVLLDVPPHVHQKYIDSAKNMSQGFLVNAINIANQFDLNYKQSRNQRLHIELALIKMCYLPSLEKLGEKKNDLNFEQNNTEKPVASAVSSVAGKVVVPTSASTQNVEKPSGNEFEKKAEAIKKVQQDSEKVAKIGSLDDLLSSNIEVVSEPKKEVVAEESGVYQQNNTVSQDALDDCITKFAEASESGIIQSMFKLVKPTIVGNTIEIKLIKQHRVQLEEVRTDFVQFLKRELQNDNLQLEIEEVKKKAEGTKAYTAQEKFEEMAKKNPSLKLLKEKLNLTIH